MYRYCNHSTDVRTLLAENNFFSKDHGGFLNPALNGDPDGAKK